MRSQRLLLAVALLVLCAPGILPAQADLAHVGGMLEQAKMHLQRGEFRQAIPFQERAIAILRQNARPNDSFVATLQVALANCYFLVGDHEKAGALLERTIPVLERTLGPEDSMVLTALTVLGQVQHARLQYAAAERTFTRLLAIRQRSKGLDAGGETGAILNLLATLYKDRGEYGRAESTYRRALPLLEKAHGAASPEAGEILNNIGVLNLKTGNYAEAERFLTRGLALREKAVPPLGREIAESFVNLAALHASRGEYSQAQAVLQRAIALWTREAGPNSPEVALCLANLAKTKNERGDSAGALPLFSRSLAIRERAFGPNHPEVASTLDGLAQTYAAEGNYGKAQELLLRALTIRTRSLPATHPGIAATFSNLAAVNANQGQYDLAAELLRRSLHAQELLLGRDHPELAEGLNALAASHTMLGEYGKAEPLYLRAVSILEKAFGPTHLKLVEVLTNLADMYWASGQTDRAIPLLQRAIEIEEQNLPQMFLGGSEEQKRAYMDTTEQRASFYLSFVAGGPGSGSPLVQLGLTTLLTRKGRLLDAVSGEVASLRRRLLESDRQLFDELLRVRSRRASISWNGPGDRNAAEYGAELTTLQNRESQLQSSIASRSAEFRIASEPVTVARVKARIPLQAALVEFGIYRPISRADRQYQKSRYIAYVLVPDGEPTSIDLGEAARIDDLVTRWRAAAANPESRDAMALARQLDELVMRRVRPALGQVRRVLLAPDGMLNLLPFGALVDEQGDYLIEQYCFSYLTSGRDLLRWQAAMRPRSSAAIFAGPDFDWAAGPPSRPAVRGDQLPGLTALRFPPIPATLEEGTLIHGLLAPSRLFSGREATKGNLMRLSGPLLLHIATHGFFLADSGTAPLSTRRPLLPDALRLERRVLPAVLAANPLLRSGLAFAGANRMAAGEGGGILTALEASSLDLAGTTLVVLSACETGLGEVRNGDGIYGLRRALVLAGSRAQVMTWWKIDDATTRDMMAAYYKRALDREDLSEALRQIQLQTMADARRSHPFFWAGFFFSGDSSPIAP